MPGAPFQIRKIKPAAKRNRFVKYGELPKSIKPTKEELLALSRISFEDGVISRRRGVVFLKDERGELEKRAVSHDTVKGSVEERILYRALQLRRVNFTFQPAIEGGRQELGGLVADFIINDRGGGRGLVIQVQGSIWHKGVFAERRDEANTALLLQKGFTVYYLWDYDIHNQENFDEWMRRFIDFAPIKTGASNDAGRNRF